jgi:hypothetical protein
MMGDLRMGAAGVTSHDDGVVDRRPSVRGLWHGGRMSSLVHQGGGSVKHEVEASRGAVEGIKATLGAG